MSQPERFEVLIVASGQGGKLLAYQGFCRKPAMPDNVLACLGASSAA
jgi:hypothetical protein